jgi:hypothetical protein
MHCERFKSRLNFVLDERLDPQADALLRGHARRCTDCADLLEAHVELFSAVEELPHPRPRADFSFRVMAAFEAAQSEAATPVVPLVSVAPKRVEPSRSKSTRRWAMPAFAATAAAVIAVVVASSNVGGPAPERAVNVAQEMPVRVGSPHVLTPFAMGPAYLGDDVEAQRVWVGELRQGMQPVTTSVYSALRTVWRTLPASELARVIL